MAMIHTLLGAFWMQVQTDKNKQDENLEPHQPSLSNKHEEFFEALFC